MTAKSNCCDLKEICETDLIELSSYLSFDERMVPKFSDKTRGTVSQPCFSLGLTEGCLEVENRFESIFHAVSYSCPQVNGNIVHMWCLIIFAHYDLEQHKKLSYRGRGGRECCYPLGSKCPHKGLMKLVLRATSEQPATSKSQSWIPQSCSCVQARGFGLGLGLLLISMPLEWNQNQAQGIFAECGVKIDISNTFHNHGCGFHSFGSGPSLLSQFMVQAIRWLLARACVLYPFSLSHVSLVYLDVRSLGRDHLSLCLFYA